MPTPEGDPQVKEAQSSLRWPGAAAEGDGLAHTPSAPVTLAGRAPLANPLSLPGATIIEDRRSSLSVLCHLSPSSWWHWTSGGPLDTPTEQLALRALDVPSADMGIRRQLLWPRFSIEGWVESTIYFLCWPHCLPDWLWPE